MKGINHFSDRANRTLSLTHHFLSRLHTVDDFFSSSSFSLPSSVPSSLKGRFILADYTGYLNICFWYLPPSLLTPPVLEFLSTTLKKEQQGEKRQKLEEEFTQEEKEIWEKIGGVAPKLKDAMQRSGGSMIGFQPLGCLPVCFRLVFIHPEVSLEEVDKLFVQMDGLGEGL